METASAPQKFYVSYEQIHNLIKKKAEEIKRDFAPEFIVAISGGGLIPARILRTFLGVPIYTVGLQLYDDTTNTAANSPTKTQWLDPKYTCVKGKRVLIVDEVDDSRLTLQYCVEELGKELEPSAIAVMVIHNKLKLKRGVLPIDVPYFPCVIVEDQWIVYPWDARDIDEHNAKSTEHPPKHIS